MSLDKSHLETETLTETSTVPLNETSWPERPSLAGQVLDGRYRIEKELGQGGVGAVYLAHDRKLHDKRVVIKVLLEKSLQNAWVVQKFQQEKEALARVDHPGVVGILDTGELPDRKPYLVMQFVDGATLRSEIKPEGIPLERAAETIRQIGRALTSAHDKGIFHRDLKPENIMRQSLGHGEEQLKIIDFGIAKLKDSLVAPSTATGSTAGTVAYMAPEQLTGKPVSAATDIFAMGVIAYEILTGRKPFNPETGYELLEMHRQGVRVQPSDLRPALSSQANQLILRALSFSPPERFQTARDFGEALAGALTSEPAPLDQTRAVPLPATQLPTQANLPVRETGNLASRTIAGRYEPARVDTLNRAAYAAPVAAEEPVGRRGWKLSVAAVLIVLIGGAAGFAVWKRDSLFGGRERSLTYSLTVQKMREGKPFQGEFESSGQEIFENGWKFRLNVANRDDGYLYLLNESTGPGSLSTYNVLFPESKMNGGSSRVIASQQLQTDWMRFDDQQGTEKFWIVWSLSPLRELEAVKDFVNERDLGEVRDPVKANGVRDFLKRHAEPKPEIAKDSSNNQTIVKGRGDTLVNFIELAHH